MATTITLKGIPDDLYARLRDTAAAHHRSINSEVIACLEQALLPSKSRHEDQLRRIAEIREKLKGRKFKAADIDQAINQGRP